jgi:monofunctional glycosyltransferase
MNGDVSPKPYEPYRRPSYHKEWLQVTGGILCGIFVLTFLSVFPFRWINPPSSSFMMQRSFHFWWHDEDRSVERAWVDWEEISPHMKVAVIASEDQRFAEHNGFDMEAIEEALDEQQRGEGRRGASTITQQTIKNLYLWGGQSYIRKGIEAYLTVWAEFLWPKQRILELYLNVAEFGNGIYGVETAAQTYFGISAGDLDIGQSALLATVLPSPRRMNPAQPSDYMIQRRNWIIDNMFLIGNNSYLDAL